MLSYNIKGLSNKSFKSDFFEYVKTFDVFFLSETHVEEPKTKEFEKYFGGFDISWKYASRRSMFGRASGGCIFGVKRGLKYVGVSHSFINIDGIDVIKISIDKIHLHVIPLYLRPNEWYEDFESLTNILTASKIDNLIVMGDLNVRIGNLQIKIAENYLGSLNNIVEERQSKDNVVNAKGKKLIDLFEYCGLFLLNGCTTDDKLGNYTFISTVGSSVNDICAVEQDIL